MSNATTYNIELRDKSGNLRTYLTPFASKISWEWNRIGGCGRCKMDINKAYRDIEFNAGDDIQIRVKDPVSGSKLVYRGWVAKTKPTLDVPQKISLDIRGYFDKLKTTIVHSAGSEIQYSNQPISTTVEAIIDTFVVPNTDITKGTIDAASYTPDQLIFKTKASEALRTLATLEGLVEYGVDENLVFFWRATDDTLRTKFFIGDDVSKFSRSIDWDKLLNKIYFEGGATAGVKLERILSAQDSIDVFFLAEGIITNSSIVTASTADQYLSEILRQKSSPQMRVKGTIVNTNIRLEDTVPLGKIAIQDNDYDQSLFTWGTTANGGSDLIYGIAGNDGSDAVWGGLFSDQIDKIKYTLSDQDNRFNVDLAFRASTVEMSATIKQLELELEQIRQAR